VAMFHHVLPVFNEKVVDAAVLQHTIIITIQMNKEECNKGFKSS
jgi:hypothetical protein